MSAKSVASRYAKSLLELADEQGKVESVYEDVELLKKMLKNRDLYGMFKSPVIPAHHKIKVINALFGGRLDDLTLRFIRLVVQKERGELLPQIALEFIDQYKAFKNISIVHITSAAVLSEEAIRRIKEKLHEKGLIDGEIEILEKIDPSLIGGFVMEFDGYRYDSSVSWLLSDLRKGEYSTNLYKSKIRAR